MTAWIASTASAGGLKSGESETTPPIIARLRIVGREAGGSKQRSHEVHEVG